MVRKVHDEGVLLDYDDRAFRVGTPSPPSAARRGSAFEDGAELLAPFADAGPARDLADRLVKLGVVERAGTTIPLQPGPGAPADTKRALAPATPTCLTVPLADDEQAVVLVEGDGVLAWRFGRAVAPPPEARKTRGGAQATHALVFEIDVPPIAAPAAGPARRGWLRDRLIEGAKAIVLYFAAEVAAHGLVKLLERSRRNGPVVINSATDPGKWLKSDDFTAVKLPADRPAKVLLLVHGTFSSTIGGFGEMTSSPWGQRLLTAALERYDAVLGFDHRTLSLSPLENAQAALTALRSLNAPQPIEFDALCHSRGGLVLRMLIERLLPPAGLSMRFKRAIFVAATNHGTELAKPENWETLVDLVTNLTAVAGKVLSLFSATAAATQVTEEVISCIGDFVKYLVEVSVDERKAPGIAAMDPTGDFVRDLNRTQPGQPSPSDIDCFAIVSNFHAKLFDDGEHEPKEMPKRLAFVIADGVIDRLMRGEGAEPVPNDLVVDVASMTEIDTAVGGFVKDVLDYGDNALVYHTNYFLRPETVGRIAQWLRLPSPLEGIDALRLAGAQRGVLPVRADATVKEVRVMLDRETPEFMVIARQDPQARKRKLLHYAVRPDEFRVFTRHANEEALLVNAFDLHETDKSKPFDPRWLPFDSTAIASGDTRPHARRGVVLSAGAPMAVLEQGAGAIDTMSLVALAHELTPTAAVAKPEPPVVTRGGARGVSPGVLGKWPPPAAPLPTPMPVDVCVTAEMPREVKLGREAVVTVSLAAEQIEAALGTVTGRLEVQTHNVEQLVDEARGGSPFREGA